MRSSLQDDEIYQIISAECRDPWSVLGIHPAGCSGSGEKLFAVRAFIPGAESLTVVNKCDSSRYVMERLHESGFFEAVIGGRDDFFQYVFEITDKTGGVFTLEDPYCFLPVLTDYDLHLFNEGNHHKIFEKLGAHVKCLCDVKGVHFAVWAPCAMRVSVIGDFNRWDGRRHQMRCLGSSGVWEIFVPGLCEGDFYKYEIKTPNGELYIKSDPYAFYSELRPGSASVVYDLDRYEWHDRNWLEKRDSGSILEKPVSIYEVHLGSWARVPDGEDEVVDPSQKPPDGGGRFLSYTELAERLVKYVKEMGYTHVELLPVSEYPFDGSWGYQVTGYYSITSRYGKPEEFMALVDAFHSEGIGVITDWVPAHFPKDGHGLARFDGTALYEHIDCRRGEHPDWGTHIFNYDRHEVRNFLVSNAVFWFEKYHIDGLRVDAVASMLYLDYGKKQGEWLPNRWGGKENVGAIEFMRQLNTTVYSYFPGAMMVAEESTSWALVSKPPYAGGLGFTFKWNMGWMNDYLRYVSMDPIYRKYHHNNLTFSIMYAMSENFILVLSHDEVVHGKCSVISKMPGDYLQKFAGLRVTYGYMYGHPGKKLLFMGGEFAQFTEWNYKQSLDWHLLDYEMHGKIQRYVKDLNKLYTSEKALFETDYGFEGFEWVDCSDSDHGVVSFIRKGKDWHEQLVFVCNFTPVTHMNYRIGVPFDLVYQELLNSDSGIYGGGNAGNYGGVHAEQYAFHGKPYSINLLIPPLAALVFKPAFEDEKP